MILTVCEERLYRSEASLLRSRRYRAAWGADVGAESTMRLF